MADLETQPPIDSTQQVTSTAPATYQKYPKHVAASKAIAERTKQAREAQQKKLAEANMIIANDRLKKAKEAAAADTAPAAADPSPAAADPPQKKKLCQKKICFVVNIADNISLATITQEDGFYV